MPIKPSSPEDEYFARQEFERRKNEAEGRARALAEEERRRLKELHHMRCPKDGMELVEIALREVKVDRCTHCGGVWLDPGELEALAVREGTGFMGGFGRLFGLGKGD